MKFGGTNWIARPAPLLNVNDGDRGIIALELAIDLSPRKQAFFCDTQDHFSCGRNRDQKLTIQLKSPSGQIMLLMRTQRLYETINKPVRIVYSWNLSVPGASWITVNDDPDFEIVTEFAGSLDYTDRAWSCGSNPGGTDRLRGEIRQAYVNLTEWLESPGLATRFARGNADRESQTPFNGVYGEKVTGNQPACFFVGDGSKRFAINRGYGGAFQQVIL